MRIEFFPASKEVPRHFIGKEKRTKKKNHQVRLNRYCLPGTVAREKRVSLKAGYYNGRHTNNL